MRPTAGVLRVALCLSSLAPLASAWPNWLPDIDSLVVRQDDPSETSASPAEETGDPTSSEESAEETADSTNSADSSEETGDSNGDDNEDNEDEDEDDGGDSLNTAEAPSGSETPSPTRSINPNDPAGGVSMQTPATTIVPTPLFKVGDNATLGWNYTSLQVTPTAIDVLISCSAVRQTWTLTGNMSFETSVEYIWDTNDQADDVENPLGTELYTLIIKDAEADITDIADPGHLGAYAQFTFGLYTPVPYTPLSEWECIACNAAMPAFDRQSLGMAIAMSSLTVLTFTWYVAGLGLN